MKSYLVFKKENIEGRKTPIVKIYNKSDEYLGIIYFYPAWRKYVFQSANDIIFDKGCLTDILNEINILQDEWRQSLKRKN